MLRKGIVRRGLGTALIAGVALLAPAGATADMVISVGTATDTDPLTGCSLRAAVISANTNNPIGGCPAGTYMNEEIVLAANTTYSLTKGAGVPEAGALTGDLDVAPATNGILEIRSPGGAVIDASTLPAGQKDRVIDVIDNGNLILTNVSIRGGVTQVGDNHGGGIRNLGQLNMTGGDITGNVSDNGVGGGVYSDGDGTELTNVTVSGNSTDDNGGGLYKDDGPFRIYSATVRGNHGGNAGGIYTLSGSVVAINSIIAGNTDGGNDSPDCLGGVFSDGSIAVGDATACSYDPGSGDIAPGTDLKLGPLADNGGGTLTYALLPGSPAIDGGSGCPATDQRGIARPIGPQCDIGAFEAPLPVVAPPPPPPPGPGGAKCPKGKVLKKVKTKGGKKKKKCVKKKKKK